MAIAFGKSHSKVLSILKETTLSQSAICAQSGLSIRTVKSTLKRLVASGCVEELPVLADARRKQYRGVRDA